MFKLIAVILCAYLYLPVQNAYKIQPRIINGDIAHEGQFPYYAFLKTETVNRRTGHCGAVVLSDEWILTAGHCLHGVSGILVLLGVSEVDTNGK